MTAGPPGTLSPSDPRPPGAPAAILSVGRYPMGLSIGTIAITGAGLALAAGNVRWGGGGGTPAGDALEPAWIYVNVALAWCWCVWWPITALWKASSQYAAPRMIRRRSRAALELAVIGVSAIPAGVAAAALNWPGTVIACQAFSVQAAFAFFATGVLTWRGRRFGQALAAVLITLGLAAPVAAYIAWEFFPAAATPWAAFIPPLAVYRAAQGLADGTFRWMVLTYAALGGALWAAGPIPSRRA